MQQCLSYSLSSFLAKQNKCLFLWMVNASELLQSDIELFTLNGECLELVQNNMKSNFISVRISKPKILQIESVLVHVSVPQTSLQIYRD